jgi:hypothetical protein
MLLHVTQWNRLTGGVTSLHNVKLPLGVALLDGYLLPLAPALVLLLSPMWLAFEARAEAYCMAFGGFLT